MSFTSRALSLDKVLKETFSLYRGHFFLFLSISAIPNLIVLVLELGLDKLPVGRPHQPSLLALLVGLSASVASLFASSIITAATTVAVADIYTDRLPDLWDSFVRLSGKAFKVVYTAFLVELFVGIGTLLCIVPGIYFAGKYGVAIPAVVLENLSGKKAVDRSEQLTTDSVGRIVIVFFLTSVCTGILVWALNAGAMALGWTSPAHQSVLSKEILRLVTTTLGGVFFGPISAIALVLEYFDLRVRYESFDIQQLKSLMLAAENLSSSTYAGTIG